MDKTTIFFDMDNTLIDRLAAAQNTYWHILKYNSTIPQENWENAFSILWDMDDNGECPKSEVFRALAKVYNFDESWVQKMVEAWFKQLPEYTITFPKSRETLEILKKYYKLGMITNGAEIMQTRKLELSGLKDLFDVVIIAGTYQMSKPDPRLFLMACEKIGCTAAEAYFVGDGIQNDILGSYAVGMSPIYIWRDDSKKCTEIDVKQIYRIEELLEVIPCQ